MIRRLLAHCIMFMVGAGVMLGAVSDFNGGIEGMRDDFGVALLLTALCYAGGFAVAWAMRALTE